MNLRLLKDQCLENATCVGAPPWTKPVDEQVVDLSHKAVYAFATGSSLAPPIRRSSALAGWLGKVVKR
jgi:hypothetical protein